MTPPAHRVPAAAAWLGALGLIPFVAGALGVWLLDAPRHDATVFLLGAYGAIILAFMGAIHWGLAMADTQRPPARTMTVSVLPALLAFVALSLPPEATLVLLAIGFVGVFVVDLGAVAAGRAPAWYPRLRTPLTLVVTLCLVAAEAGLLLRDVR